MTPAARIAASIDLLEAVEASSRPADAIANDFFRTRRYIGSGDRRAVSDRAWSVLRHRRRLTWWLDRAHALPTPRLLIAASLLLEGWTLDGVEQSFSGGQFAAARLLAPERAALKGMEGRTPEHPAMPPAVRAEVPDWIFAPLHEKFGPGTEAELAALATPAPLDLRVNLLKTTREAAQSALAAEGIETTPTPYSPWGLRIPTRRALTTGPAFQSGLVEIQDEGSQLVALLVGAAPHMRVADWCAGAGGKTLAVAMSMNNRGHIVACDVHDRRLEAAVKRLRRAGVHNVEQHLIAAGDKWAKRQEKKFDRVLVDAPCTGCGTWRRNPDAGARLTETDLQQLVVKQAAILDAAARLTKPGGRLIYATCSLLPAENEAQVQAFTLRHPDYAVLPLEEAWPLPSAPPCPGPFLSLTPLRHNTDGFFGAVLVRAPKMITVRPARIADAAAIGAVHVAAWRSTYPGILPDAYLSRLSPIRHARNYEMNIATGASVIVAAPNSGTPRLVGFTTAGPARVNGLGDGEIETLYVLDDWREQGLGRRLLHAAAKDLASHGCRSAFLWVLRDNPSRFFYQHLGGHPSAQGETRVAGVTVPQLAYSWDPIDRLLAASPA